MAISTKQSQGLPPLRRVLVVGNGGRENALGWAIQGCPEVEEVWISPGNGGTQELNGCKCLPVEDNLHQSLINNCLSHQIDLVVIGPEAPLAAGLADELREAGLTVFGPGSVGAQLEASKDWAKTLMSEANIPTAQHWTVKTEEDALKTVENIQQPLVVKADGLASGKGVTVAETINETCQAIRDAFNGRFGEAGSHLVLEERLQGPEVSVFALCDGKRLILLPPAQDHKRLEEGDRGPNTGGMGAYAPAPLLDSDALKEVQKKILEPTLATLQKRGIDYRGVIYAGLMLTKSGPSVIEYNCRFGDPECQVLMPLMGEELAKVLQACALGRLEQAPKLIIKSGCSACVVAASSGYPQAPRQNDSLEIKLRQGASLQLFHAGTKKNAEGKLVTSGGRVLAVVAQANDFDEAFSLVYKGLKQIHYDGINYRRDIGYQVRQH